jgi:hypothetical protein
MKLSAPLQSTSEFCIYDILFYRMPGDTKQRQESPNGEEEESSNPNATEQSSDDDSKKNLKKPDEKKHNSGAADLEKVTDYAEEKEITSSSTELTDAIANIRK